MSHRPPTGPCGSRPPTTTTTVAPSASRTTAYYASRRPEHRMSPVEDTMRGTQDAYPVDLARFVRERWNEDRAGTLPDQGTLETLISACYQAGLLREEERAVTFRVILCDPDLLPPREGPPEGTHRLEFPRPRQFDVQELRRLSPAADYYRSLIGVCFDEEEGLRIWGLVHTGPRWLRGGQGGRDAPPPLPPTLVLRAYGQGRMAVDIGLEALCKLEEGRLSDTSMDVFDSRWLPATFAPVRGEIAEIHARLRDQARKKGEVWARLDNDIIRVIGQHTIKRIISAVRDSHHGGTLVIVPPYLAEDILEVAHLIAGLTAVDGAVVMTQRFEMLGFGGEISGRLQGVETVARALDVEADAALEESVGGVGTRHRSAYRLCNALRDVIAVVISQDGNVRFVKRKNEAVTYWDQA